MAKRVKTDYDRGYVNAMDKIRVFIESSSKVMYVDPGHPERHSGVEPQNVRHRST